MINSKQFQKFYRTLYLFAQESFKGNTRVISWLITLFGSVALIFIILLKYVYKTANYADTETINIMLALYLSSVFLTSSLAMLLSTLTLRPSSKMIQFLEITFVEKKVIVLVLKFLKLIIFLVFFSFFNLTQSIPVFTTLPLLEAIYYVLIAYTLASVIYLITQIILTPLAKIKFNMLIEVIIYSLMIVYNLFSSFSTGEFLHNFELLRTMLDEHKIIFLFVMLAISILLLFVYTKLNTVSEFNTLEKHYVKLSSKIKMSFEHKFIVMILSQLKNLLIYVIHVVLLIISFTIDQTYTFVIPSLLLPLCLSIFANTKQDRLMNYLYGVTTKKEMKALYIIIVILIAPYVIINLPNLNIQIMKAILYNLNMFIIAISIGYTFPTDTSIIDNFTSNFIILIALIFNVLIYSLSSVYISIGLSMVIFIIANIILILEINGKVLE